MTWLKRRGPFHVILDGANIGLFSHFHDTTAIHYEQVQAGTGK
jgi:hypothetical protein